MKPEIRAGDFFLVENLSRLGFFINLWQRIVSADNVARLNHGGLIITDKGDTLESLWTVRSHNLFKRYAGVYTLIARPKISDAAKCEAISRILDTDLGKAYPIHRLLYMIAPPLAKYTSVKSSVCSELTAKYLYYAGVRHKYFQGTTPDKLADEVHHWKEYDIIYEGILPGLG